MNRRINPHIVPVDENSDASEFRLKLSPRSFRFLSLAVKSGQVIASFEEEEVEKGCNQSFFLYRDGQVVRCKGSFMASFTLGEHTYHLYGTASL